VGWQAAAAYFKCYPLPRPGWAWEFTRRHPDYQAAYEADSSSARRRKGADSAAEWGLMLLEDPAIHARDALVFWRADAQPGMLRAEPWPLRANPRALDLWAEPGRKAVTLTQAGLVVLVEREGEHFRLVFQDLDALSDRMVFDIRIGSPPESLAEMDSARSFLGTFLDGRERRRTIDPLAPFLARYLQALDGHLAGASYADIGRAVYPGDKAFECANGYDLMKGRGRHAVKRGLYLMNGGYRRLLLPPPVSLFSDAGV
jgi:hypothetical protein